MKNQHKKYSVTRGDKVVWDETDRSVAVIKNKVVYTENQKLVLWALDHDRLPDTPFFRMVNEILVGKYELKHPAKIAGSMVNIEGLGPIEIRDTPVGRIIDAICELLGHDFGRIFLATLREGDKGRKWAEDVQVEFNKAGLTSTNKGRLV
jgi:hypothetical protein